MRLKNSWNTCVYESSHVIVFRFTCVVLLAHARKYFHMWIILSPVKPVISVQYKNRNLSHVFSKKHIRAKFFTCELFFYTCEMVLGFVKVIMVRNIQITCEIKSSHVWIFFRMRKISSHACEEKKQPTCGFFPITCGGGEIHMWEGACEWKFMHARFFCSHAFCFLHMWTKKYSVSLIN